MAKVLYLTDPLPDYLADQLFMGLYRCLGSEAIVDYPSKALYHDPGHRVWFLPQVPERPHSESEVVALLESRFFDLLCLSSPRKGAINALHGLRKKCRLPPLVIIDGEDDARLQYRLFEEYQAALYFKREYIWIHGRRVRRWKDLYNYCRSVPLGRITPGRNLFPLSFSVVLPSIPTGDETERGIDVSFRGLVSSRPSRVRLEAMKRLRSIEGIRLAGALYTHPDPTGRLSAEAYYQEIRSAKIAVSMRGAGFDTYRFWEVPACGAMLLSERPDILIPNGFVDGEHAVFCRPDLKDLKDLVRHYLSNDSERERIARAGREYVTEHHTCEKRAQYVLDICGKHL